MAESKGLVRPRQVTMATVMAIVGSLVLVVSLVDTLAGLRTPETREAVEEFLSRSPGSGLAVDTAQVIDAMRALAYLSGALAAAAVVLAVFVLQRHRGARVGLTVVAGLLLLTVPVAGLLPVFVAVAATLVWSRPARDWYAGTAAAARPDQRVGSPPTSTVWEQTNAPAPTAPPAAAPTAPPAAPSPSVGASPAYPGYPGIPGIPGPSWAPARRPVTVTVAAVLTWIGAGLVTAAMLLTAVVLAVSSDAFLEQFEEAARDSGVSISDDQALALGWGVTGLLLFWSLSAIVLAVFAVRRSNGARIALAVSAVMAALLSLVLVLSLVSVVTLLLAGAAAVLLFTGGANEWYRRGGPPPGPADPSAPPSYQPAREKQKPW